MGGRVEDCYNNNTAVEKNNRLIYRRNAVFTCTRRIYVYIYYDDDTYVRILCIMVRDDGKKKLKIEKKKKTNRIKVAAL